MGRSPLTADQTWIIAERAMLEAQFISYTPPEKRDDPISIWLSRGLDTYRESEWSGDVELLLDAYSGEVSQDGRQLQTSWGAAVYESWFYTTHAATYVPWYVKLPVWAVFGLTPLLLALTGLRMWRHKRRSHQQAQTRQSARPQPGSQEAPALPASED